MAKRTASNRFESGGTSVKVAENRSMAVPAAVGAGLASLAEGGRVSWGGNSVHVHGVPTAFSGTADALATVAARPLFDRRDAAVGGVARDQSGSLTVRGGGLDLEQQTRVPFYTYRQRW